MTHTSTTTRAASIVGVGALLLGAVLSAPIVLGQEAPVTIRAGLLLDGTGERMEGIRIFVEDGKISRIDRLRGAVTYDLSNLTVMPGLIDTHVHLTSHFDADGKIHRPAPEGEDPAHDVETMLHAVGNAQRMLDAGFTTVRSLGDRLDARLRDHVADGRLRGPRVLTSLDAVRAETGDPAAIRAFVRQLADDGADVIKVFASTSIRDGGLRAMDDAQIEAACQEAETLGLPTAVHAYGTDVVSAAARAGCTTIEHGTNYGEDAIAVLVEEGTYVDPHLALLYDNYFDNRDAYMGVGNYTGLGFVRMEEARRVGLETFRESRFGNVKIVFGTDAVAGAHGRNAEELVARVEEGRQNPMDAIVSATSLAAESIGLGDHIGRIASGYEADLIAVEGNPLDNIGAIRNVRWVMKGGEVQRNDLEPARPERPSRRRRR